MPVKISKRSKLTLFSLLLLHYFAVTFAAPMSDALGLTPFPHPANSSNNSYTTKLALPISPPLSASIHYLIPDTTITLIMDQRPLNPIPPEDLRVCLDATSSLVMAHVHEHGDGLLEASDDPFKRGPFPNANCSFVVRSWHFMTPLGRIKYMTYGIVYTVLAGLMEYMLAPDPHCYFTTFTVSGAARGTVGAGSIGPTIGETVRSGA